MFFALVGLLVWCNAADILYFKRVITHFTAQSTQNPENFVYVTQIRFI